ncbi:hypothetical protein ACFYKX_26585 [Cytobacillus sp. FJAT-54145]|uniref:Large polyvalent protein associated domain-containing protein n=1 Tax=Cytobacillus spartinae TaxID=3299023 RepID=A0ABW6KK71_9BACI
MRRDHDPNWKPNLPSKYQFNQSKYQPQANQMFGGFTPYNPPSGSYYRDLGQKARIAEEERKKKEKENELYNKYGIDPESTSEDGSAFQVKADDYFADEEPKEDNDNSFFGDIGEGLKSAFKAIRNPADLPDIVMDFAKKEKSKGFEEAARGANRFVDSASLGVMSNLDKKMTGEIPDYLSQRKMGEGGVTDMLTSGAGYLIPGVGAYKALGATKAGKGLEALGKQGLKQRLGAEAAKGAITGAGLAGAEVGIREELNPENYSASDNLKHLAFGTTVGAFADPAIYGAGKAIASIIKSRKTPVANQTEELLGLPEPQKRLMEPQKQLPEPKPLPPSLETFNQAFKKPNGLESPIPQMPKGLSQLMTKERLQQEGLNFGFNTKNTPKARKDLSPIETPIDPMNRGQSYWQNRYEEFARSINDNYDMNQMTPEALEDLWSGFAKYDEPLKLEQVVDLAYPKGFEAPPKPKPEAPLTQALRQDEKINQLIKGLYPPKAPETKVSRPATMEEMVKRMEQLAPPKRQEPSSEPLQFKKSIESPKAKQQTVGEKSEPIDDGGKMIRLKDSEMKGFEKLGIDVSQLKDISGFKAATTDVYRIFRDVFGENYDKAGKPVLDKLDNAKKSYVEMQEKWANKLKVEVVDKLGIKKGSKESALVQRYGEKKMSLNELKKVAPNNWKDIVKADQWFRQAYDEIYDGVNKSRNAIYPNNPEKHVPKLDNYYRHFREMNGLTGLKNIFDSPAQIDPHLAGLSQHTNPNSKWHGFMQKRGMGPYKEDAVGGFIEYIPGSSYATHIDPVIPEFKQLRKTLADSTEDTKNVNNFVEYLYNYSNDLAGKTNPYFDRNFQQLVGRKPMAVLNWANNRVKKNVILGNIGSALAQLANIPNGVAFAKQHTVRGMARTLTSIVDKDAPIHKSPFLKERYVDGLFRQFDQRLIDQPEKAAGWMIETADRIGTSFVWNSAYQKGLKEGASDPIKYADYNTRALIAGRGVGEVPLMQKSRVVQLVMPFTLEVANLWRVMEEFGKDFIKGKDMGALPILFVANFAFNKVMEETRGFGVTFDPIDATWEAATEKDLSPAERVGRVGGEILTNIPLGQQLAGIYPENGSIFNFKGPTREELFGDRNPQRFGTGLVAANALDDTIFKFALPFGGNQLKKTLNGVEGLNDEGEYIKDAPLNLPFIGEKDKLKYPVDPNVSNKLKGTLFGPSAFNESNEYYDNKRRPLSENQTAEYEDLKQYEKGDEYYKDLMNNRRANTIEQKMKEIDKDENLSIEEKRIEILKLMKELNDLQ